MHDEFARIGMASALKQQSTGRLSTECKVKASHSSEQGVSDSLDVTKAIDLDGTVHYVDFDVGKFSWLHWERGTRLFTFMTWNVSSRFHGFALIQKRRWARVRPLVGLACQTYVGL